MIWSPTNDISTTPSGSATYKNDAIPRRLAGRRITFVSIMSEAFLCAGSRNVITSACECRHLAQQKGGHLLGPCCVKAPHRSVQPPSTATVWPTTNDEASLARKTSAPFSSSSRPTRPIGVRRSIQLTCRGSWS